VRRFLCSLVAGVFFAAFAGGITPAPAPPPAATIPLDGDAASPPFVRAKVRGASFWFLLDTASPSSFGRKQALGLGLPEGSSVNDLAIELPGITFTMRTLALADLEPRQIALGHRLDGVLGSEFFARFVVTLDFQARTLTLRDPKTFRSAGKGRALPLTIENGLFYVDAKVTPRGHETLAGKFLVDTAAEGAVTLFSPLVRQHHLLGPPPTAPAGSGGTLQGVTRGETLDLKGLLLREPVILLSGSTSGILSDSSHAGLLGMEVLRRFQVTLDASRKRLSLEKSAAFSEPFEYDASGLRVQPQGADLTTLEIRRVMPGSPGAQAGLQTGDVILAVDGRPVGEITPHGVRRLFQKDEKEYGLSILRRGEIRQVRLKCRRLI
jgi:PDZ domain